MLLFGSWLCWFVLFKLNANTYIKKVRTNGAVNNYTERKVGLRYIKNFLHSSCVDFTKIYIFSSCNHSIGQLSFIYMSVLEGMCCSVRSTCFSCFFFIFCSEAGVLSQIKPWIFFSVYFTLNFFRMVESQNIMLTC